MQGFRQALEDSNLVQIPIVGSFFTWEKGRESNNLVREKLDRALAIEDWAHKFTNVVCSVIHVPRLDHKPLVINTAPKDNWGDRKRFQFDNAWLCDEGLAESIFYGGFVDCEWVFELVPPLISDVNNVDLCAPFSNEEFRAALFQMHPNKAPGPDGLNPAFY
ncbi:uncharacterized protein LOC122724811 [Manihot esculenta]|uniref:uncharacterized protein LOC122724811 n=1 Tax=Manihot esculenta TaxID=3983 RepID=UPI001CC5E5B5|nr:uncharacterized protein LOC122724811 [Manihot esculenta]